MPEVAVLWFMSPYAASETKLGDILVRETLELELLIYLIEKWKTGKYQKE